MRRLLRSPLWLALLITLVIAAVQVGDLLDHAYWNVAYKLMDRPAPASIVVITADDIDALGARGEARLFDAVRAARPGRMFVDVKLVPAVSAGDRNLLRSAIAALDPATAFVVRPMEYEHKTRAAFRWPDPAMIGSHRLVVSAWADNFLYFAESSPYSINLGGARYPTLAAELAGRDQGLQSRFYGDFSVDPATITTYSDADILSGRVGANALAGRQVILSQASQGVSYGYFGHQFVNPVVVDIAGAAALMRPLQVDLTGVALLVLVFGLLWLGHNRPAGSSAKRLAYATALVAIVMLPALLRGVGVVAYPQMAQLCTLIFGGIRLWQKRIRRVQLTSASGLPNMLALSNSELPVGCDVVVAAIARYEEMLATLPRELHGECARQIARRIAVDCGTESIYHSDGGHFAWIEEARPLDMQLSHLEGLRALFAAPIQVGPHTFDTNIHFGLDRNEGVETTTRVNSALASANEALANGRAIDLFEAHRLAEAPWELSLHARIDEGLRNGDIWLAFQPQWDIASGRICGAEALIRWNHPTRGPIAPNAFILQAERAGRIDALTYWVLDQAITVALAINARGEPFQMSVNLSGQMVDKPDLVRTFGAIVVRRGIDPHLITVEVTETSSVGNRTAAVSNLTQLRQMGFRLSIDDFGTGEASLAYLADLPSDELKLDRRFVSRIVTSERDRTIVASTIGLAHALGQTVVAEGIEDAATLAMLREMGCDHAQGFLLGRPQPFTEFEKTYDTSQRREVGLI